MDRVAGSFGFPFRKGAGRAWLVGLVLLLLFPLGIWPLLGYSVRVVRTAAAEPEAGPPAWRPWGRLVRDGVVLGLVLALLALPLVFAGWLLAGLFGAWIARMMPTLALPEAAGWVAALGVAGLPWGILLLVLMPPAVARFAGSGSAGDLLDLPASLRTVRERFGAWNLAVVAIVTAWAIGFCGLGLALVGVIPGVLYAMLVSSHAAASLADA